MRGRSLGRATRAVVRCVALVVCFGAAVWAPAAGAALRAVPGVPERTTDARFTALPGLGDVFAATGDRYFVYRTYYSLDLTVVDTRTMRVERVRPPAPCQQAGEHPDAAEDRVLVACPSASGEFGFRVFDLTTRKLVPGATELTGVGTPTYFTGRYCAPFDVRLRNSALQQIDRRALFSAGRAHHLRVGRCGDRRSERDVSARKAESDRSLLGGWTTWAYPLGRLRCRVGSYDVRSGVRTVWRRSPFGATRCTERTLHTRYAVIAAHEARPTTGPKFLSGYRFAIARRP